MKLVLQGLYDDLEETMVNQGCDTFGAWHKEQPCNDTTNAALLRWLADHSGYVLTHCLQQL